MKYIGQNGHMIQCMSPPEGSHLDWSIFHKGTSLSIEKPLTAFTAFTEKSLDDIQALLFDMQGDSITKVISELIDLRDILIRCFLDENIYFST